MNESIGTIPAAYSRKIPCLVSNQARCFYALLDLTLIKQGQKVYSWTCYIIKMKTQLILKLGLH